MPPEPPTPEQLAAANAVRVLKLVAATLPHLSGLCHTIRVKVTKKYPVAAIGASGLMLVNPRVFSTAPLPDLVFVVAHELMHLALDTFGRSGNADPYLVNIAHDFVINDILSTELSRDVPLGGLVRHGARQESLEAIVAELASNERGDRPNGCWSIERKKKPKRVKKPKTAMQEELERAGLLPPEADEPDAGEEEADPDEYPPGDALTAEEEEDWEPELGPKERSTKCERVRREAVRAVSLKELREQMDKATGHGSGGNDAGASRALMEAVATAYQPPWQLALQHWLDAVSPGPRSYAKPSRRGANRDDGVILAGRKREGWALHVVMDTSGSMVDTLPRILGLLASFCEGAGVNQVHIMQCDTGVTVDEWLDPAELMNYKITGFGGSDMSPAMLELAGDPEVNAVLVLTDGYIDYPHAELPYNVLWGLVDGDSSFSPLYGTVVHVKT
jgi:predicted metal-dependent peptidase